MTLTATAPASAAPTRLHCPLDADEIRNLLPHRWPFLYLDRVTELKTPERAAGLKNVAIAEPYFAGHFPGQAIMPGALIIETLAQLGGILLAATNLEGTGGDGGWTGRGFIAGVKNMRFRKPVVPGDQLRLRVSRVHVVAGLAELRAEAKVGTTVVADGVLVLAV